MAAALAYPSATAPRVNLERLPVPINTAPAQLVRATARFLGVTDLARINHRLLLQACQAARLAREGGSEATAGMLDPRVFEAWNQLVHVLIWQGDGRQRTGGALPLALQLFTEGPAETAAQRAFALVGMPHPTVTSRAGLQALAEAGEWNSQRAAAVLHLLFLTPEYFKRWLP
jgi:hypothetical protein